MPSEAHQQTLLQIFQHKATPIEWTDLVHLVEEVGEIAPKDGVYPGSGAQTHKPTPRGRYWRRLGP